MELRIENQRQFNFILSTALTQYPECVIEIHSLNHVPMCIVQTSINNNITLVSICGGDQSYGKMFYTNDTEDKMKFLTDDFIRHLPISFIKGEYLIAKITNKGNNENIITDINTDDEINEENDCYNIIMDYRDEYMETHKRIKTQNPISINTYEEAMSYFDEFLTRNDSNKITFEFSTEMPDLNHTFKIELVIDKLYSYGRTLLSFITIRPDVDDIRFTNPSDSVLPLQKNPTSVRKIDEKFIERMKECFVRCDLVSEQKVKINVYSNCKLNGL